MIRVVADTNIFLSAPMFGGMARLFVDLCLIQPAPLTSRAILGELQR